MPRISLKILPLSLRSVSIEEYVQGIKIWVQRNQFFSLVTSQHSSEDLAVGPPTAPLTSKALSGNFCLSTKLVAQARIRHSQKFTFYSHYNDQVVNFVFVYTLFSGIFGIALMFSWMGVQLQSKFWSRRQALPSLGSAPLNKTS